MSLNLLGPKIQITLLLIAFFAIWTLRAFWLINIDRSIESPESRVAFSTLVKVVLWAVPAALFGYWLRRESPIRYLGISAFPAAKVWAICLLSIFSFCALILFFETQVGQKRIFFGSLSAIGLPSKTAFYLISPFVEEVFFRGMILKEFSRFMRPVFANIVSALLFVGIHFPYWISSGMDPQNMARTSLGILLFSLFAGWLFIFGKSIWPPTAAHIANNILSASIVPG